MGMFVKTMDIEQEMKKVDGEAISSIIDKTMTIKGEMFFKGKARIDGAVKGNIKGEHLILSETGKVIGDITVSSFNCYGSLEGNIKATMLTARKNSSIHGKLEAANLSVESGASLEGEIKAATTNQQQQKEKKVPTPKIVEESASKQNFNSPSPKSSQE